MKNVLPPFVNAIYGISCVLVLQTSPCAIAIAMPMLFGGAILSQIHYKTPDPGRRRHHTHSPTHKYKNSPTACANARSAKIGIFFLCVRVLISV